MPIASILDALGQARSWRGYRSNRAPRGHLNCSRSLAWQMSMPAPGPLSGFDWFETRFTWWRGFQMRSIRPSVSRLGINCRTGSTVRCSGRSWIPAPENVAPARASGSFQRSSSLEKMMHLLQLPHSWGVHVERSLDRFRLPLESLAKTAGLVTTVCRGRGRLRYMP